MGNRDVIASHTILVILRGIADRLRRTLSRIAIKSPPIARVSPATTAYAWHHEQEWVREAAIVLVLALVVVVIIAMALMTTTPAVPAHASVDRSRWPIAITAVIMLAIATTAVSTPLVIVHETMALFSITVNGAGDVVRPFCAASAHVIAVSECCRRPLGIALKVEAIRYSGRQHGKHAR